MKIHPAFTPYVAKLIEIYNERCADPFEFSFPQDNDFFLNEPGNREKFNYVYRAFYGPTLRPSNFNNLRVSVDFESGIIIMQITKKRSIRIQTSKHNKEINELIIRFMNYTWKIIRDADILSNEPTKPEEDFGFLNFAEI